MSKQLSMWLALLGDELWSKESARRWDSPAAIDNN